MDGATLYSLQRELNESEVPTWRDYLWDEAGRSTRDRKWSQKAIQQALCNPRTAGYLLHNGEIVEGDDAEPVFITDEPIFTQQEWAEVTAKLTVHKGGPRAQRRPSLLGGIARCGHDKTPLGSRRNVMKRDYKDEPDVYHKYMCRLAYSGAKDECGVFLQQADLDSFVEDALLGHLGDLEVMEPASSTVSILRSELHSVSARLARLEADYAAGKYDGEGQEESYVRIHGMVCAKLSKLRASVSEARHEYVPTGRTYRQVWESKAIEEKRSFLIDHKVEVRVWKNLVPWSKLSIKVDLGDIGGMARAAGLEGLKADWVVTDHGMPTELMLLRVADTDRLDLSKIDFDASR